jgi:hypothetical protein
VIFKNEALLNKVLSEPELKTIFDKAIDMNLHIGNFIAPEVLDSLYKKGAIRYDKSFLQAVLQTDKKSQNIIKKGGSPFINAIFYLEYALDKKIDLSMITPKEWFNFYQRRMKYMSLSFQEKFYRYCPEIKEKFLGNLYNKIYYDMTKMQIEKINYLLDNHQHSVHDVVKIVAHWRYDMQNHHKPRFLALAQRMQDEGEEIFKTFVGELNAALQQSDDADNDRQYEFRKLLNNIVLYDKLKEDLPDHEPLESSSKGLKI